MAGPVRTCWLIFLAVPIALGLHNQRVGGEFATAFFIGLIPAALVWALGEVAAFTVREWWEWRRTNKLPRRWLCVEQTLRCGVGKCPTYFPAPSMR